MNKMSFPLYFVVTSCDFGAIERFIETTQHDYLHTQRMQYQFGQNKNKSAQQPREILRLQNAVLLQCTMIVFI